MARPLVYFGNGDFRSLQHSFARLEAFDLKRNWTQVTALLGYAGSRREACEACEVCLNSSHEAGMAQVVAISLDEKDFGAFLKRFYESFRGAKGARDRPQVWKGMEFRSCIGIPGGHKGELYKLVQSENAFQMDLRAGQGSDPDAFNVLWVYDSLKFPFSRAEQYLQFVESELRPEENWYHGCLRNAQLLAGRIEPTKCPEMAPPGATEIISHRLLGSKTSKIQNTLNS